MNELALFAGAGGGILGGKLLGWKTVCAVELDDYCRRVLAQRQLDGHLDPFPMWDDIQTFDGTPWAGRVDIITGGFPCQDISAAGKGAGLAGERSGLWREMARIIHDVGPRYVLVENSPVLTSRGLGVVLGDLAAMGFDARWGVLGAHHTGAPHKRDRIWIVSHSDRNSLRQLPRRISRPDRTTESPKPSHNGGESSMAHPARNEQGRPEQRTERERTRPGSEPVAMGHPEGLEWNERQTKECSNGSELPVEARGPSGPKRGQWWLAEPDVGRVAHGVAARVDRLKSLGNGQVPAVAALAWEIMSQDFIN